MYFRLGFIREVQFSKYLNSLEESLLEVYGHTNKFSYSEIFVKVMSISHVSFYALINWH